MNSLAAWIALTLAVVALLLFASNYGDPPETLVDVQVSHRTAGLAPSCRSHPMPQPNHFATINRDVRRMT